MDDMNSENQSAGSIKSEYTVCQVRINSDGSIHLYLDNALCLKVGDIVEVPVGATKNAVTGKVVSITNSSIPAERAVIRRMTQSVFVDRDAAAIKSLKERKRQEQQTEIAEIDRKMRKLRGVIVALSFALVMIGGAAAFTLGMQNGSQAVKNARPTASASHPPGWLGERRPSPSPTYTAEQIIRGNTLPSPSPVPEMVYHAAQGVDMTPHATNTPRTTPKPSAKPKPSSDPYHASDYYHPEDFYEYYYDDFWDYEDAEDYWEEYN